MKKPFLSALLASFVVLLFASGGISQNVSQGKIVVEMTGFRTDKGMAKVALFRGKDGFPGKLDKAIDKAQAPIQNGKATVVFENVPFGEYALAVYHDENGNNKMDKKLIMPTEGLAVSNNAKGRFGPPKYEDAKFQLDNPEEKQNLKIIYL